MSEPTPEEKEEGRARVQEWIEEEKQKSKCQRKKYLSKKEVDELLIKKRKKCNQ